MWTVAAANKRFEGPLGNYNGLSDQHLAHHFSNPVVKSHLLKAGLVTKDGIIVSESDVKLMNIQKEKQKSYCDLLAAAIVQKALHLEYAQQAKIQQHLESISKMQLVERIKNVYKKGSKISSDSSFKKVQLCEHCHSVECFCNKQEETDEKSIFAAGNCHPIICGDFLCGSQKFTTFRDKSCEEVHEIRKYCRTVKLHVRPHSVNILSSSKKLSTKESPYLYSIFARGSKKSLVSSKRLSKSATYNFHKVKPRVVKKISSNVSQNLEVDLELNLRDTESTLSLQPHNGNKMQKLKKFQDKCRVTLYYHGDKSFYAVEEMKNQMQDMIVNQQHCGGNPIVVFRGRKSSKDTLTFVSHRHSGYPFSITIFVDGIRTLKLSACCEYRYLKGSRLGGKNGYFSIVAVEGGSPCIKCLNSESMWTYTPLSFQNGVAIRPQKKLNATFASDKRSDNGKDYNNFKRDYLDFDGSHEEKKNIQQVQATTILDLKEVEIGLGEKLEYPLDLENIHNLLEDQDVEEVKSESNITQCPEEISEEAYSEVNAGPEQCIDLECYTDTESDCSTNHASSSTSIDVKRSSSQNTNALDRHFNLNARNASEDGGEEHLVFAEVHVTPNSQKK